MTAWFRFYEAALDDPKVQTLPGDDFKAWVNILCVACRHDGTLPQLPALAFMLRMSLNDCETLIERLSNAGLIDRKNGGPNGSRYAPHGWDKRQYKSDSSSGRVKRYRERSAPVAETPPDTEAETDTEAEKKQEQRGASAPDFAFVGKVVRLNVADFARWRERYGAIPDLMAELTKADDYYAENPPKDGKWFFAVSRWLAKAHDEARRPVRDDDRIYRGVL